jgi:hypothetical protein
MGEDPEAAAAGGRQPRFTKLDRLELPNLASLVRCLAAGFQPAGLADAERLGPVWARVKADTAGQASPRLELLAKEIKAVGTIGVRPLTKEEIAVYRTADAVAPRVHEASRRTDAKAIDAPSVRRYYCAWSKDSGVGDDLRKYQPEFFRWLGC